MFDIVRSLAWPSPYTGRALRNRFMARWQGRDRELARALGVEATAFQAAAREEDFDTAMVWAGEAVDLIVAVEGAAQLLRRISAQAQERLRIGARLIRGDATQDRRGNDSVAGRV